VIVQSPDENLGLEVDTSEESQEDVNDGHPYDEHEEDIASSNHSENEPSSPITPKSSLPLSLVSSEKPDSLEAEESATGKADQQH
jgi:hypothetical protein